MAVTGFQKGMKLEAKDRKNVHLTCVATVEELNNDGTLEINFDGWSTKYVTYGMYILTELK